VPVSLFNNELALDQMEVAYTTLLRRDVPHPDHERTIGSTRPFAKDHREHPKIVTYVLCCAGFFASYFLSPCSSPLPSASGGDHTVVLPILRSLNKIYGPVSVIHFDAHLDTWAPWAEQERITHGTFFHVARQEGLLSNTSVHAGIRCKMTVRPANLLCDTHSDPCRARLI
jgi:agmatinase